MGITSLLAEGTDAHPQLGKGVDGFGRYYWRGLVDKTDGNYLVIFALPNLSSRGRALLCQRRGSVSGSAAIYAASRILITPDYHGHDTFNASEVFGRAMAQGISTAYYPSHDRTAERLPSSTDGQWGGTPLTNIFREFWPDIATHVLHRHP